VPFEESTFQQTLAEAEEFAESNGLDFVLRDPDTLSAWCIKWLGNGWQDDDGRDMDAGCIYRQDGTKRLLPRWASMLLGLERGYMTQAGNGL
jgi:hypothetical protein